MSIFPELKQGTALWRSCFGRQIASKLCYTHTQCSLQRFRLRYPMSHAPELLRAPSLVEHGLNIVIMATEFALRGHSVRYLWACINTCVSVSERVMHLDAARLRDCRALRRYPRPTVPHMDLHGVATCVRGIHDRYGDENEAQTDAGCLLTRTCVHCTQVCPIPYWLLVRALAQSNKATLNSVCCHHTKVV